MSLVGDAIGAMRDFVVLSEKVERIGTLVDALASEVRAQDRRLVRLETMVEMTARARAPRAVPPPASEADG